MTLANLQKLVEKVTPGPWESVKTDSDWYGQREDEWFVFLGEQGADTTAIENEADAALIAAAPEMAKLLIACEEALRLRLMHGHNDTCQSVLETTERYPCNCGHAECFAALARLADFDQRIA